MKELAAALSELEEEERQRKREEESRHVEEGAKRAKVGRALGAAARVQAARQLSGRLPVRAGPGESGCSLTGFADRLAGEVVVTWRPIGGGVKEGDEGDDEAGDGKAPDGSVCEVCGTACERCELPATVLLRGGALKRKREEGEVGKSEGRAAKRSKRSGVREGAVHPPMERTLAELVGVLQGVLGELQLLSYIAGRTMRRGEGPVPGFLREDLVRDGFLEVDEWVEGTDSDYASTSGSSGEESEEEG